MRPLRLLRLHPRLPPRRRTRPRALFPRCQPKRLRRHLLPHVARRRYLRAHVCPRQSFARRRQPQHGIHLPAAPVAQAKGGGGGAGGRRRPSASHRPALRTRPEVPHRYTPRDGLRRRARRERRLRRLDGGRKRVRVDRTRVRRRSAPPTRAHVRATTARVRWIGRYSRRGRGRRRGDERRFGDDDDGRVGTPGGARGVGVGPRRGGLGRRGHRARRGVRRGFRDVRARRTIGGGGEERRGGSRAGVGAR